MATDTKPKRAKAVPAAQCHGVKVPESPLLSPARIKRINAARYERHEISGALAVVRPGDKVLEMGAGLGLVGAIVAKNAKPAKVMSFEANPGLIDPIRALYRMNRLSKKIELRNELLISAPNPPEVMGFHVHNSYLGSSLIEAENRSTTRVEVPTACYADVHADFAPDVLLMDIEGSELEFLRDASLDGLRAIVIEFHPHAYGRDGMRECKDILEQAGFVKLPEHSTRQVWTCARIPKEEPPRPDGGWSTQIEAHENAVVVPTQEQRFVQRTGVLTADGTYLANGALWRNGRALTIAPTMPRSPLKTRKGTWLWGGVLWMHFGHFLVESMSRLWALSHLETEIDGILFTPKRLRNGTEVLPYQQTLVDLMGANVPVICLAEPERIERLIVPGQGFGLGNMIAGTTSYRAAIATKFANDIAADGPEKLYISRSALPTGRGNLIGEAAFEAHLSAEGYTIYHPEKHDIHHQIATYKAARKVIAAEGSSLHLLAMIADATQDIAIIVRRPSGATRNLEVHLTRFTGKAPVSVSHLIRSWKPKATSKPRSWKGELDMPAVHASLVASGFIHEGGRKWPSLEPGDVQDLLGAKFEQAVPTQDHSSQTENP